MIAFDSIQLTTARVLRDNQSLREVSKREEVLKIVRESLPNASFSTVDRCCRKIQNELKMWTVEDSRYELQSQYKDHFSKRNEG